jgi:hypothetical protein
MASMFVFAAWKTYAYSCNANVPTNCNNASKTKVGPCTVVTPNVAFPGGTCQGATTGYQACGTAANYNCVIPVTYSGTFCTISNGNQTNVVSQTLVDTTSGTCP